MLAFYLHSVYNGNIKTEQEMSDMKKMSKAAALALAAVLSLTAFAGCGQKTPSSSAPSQSEGESTPSSSAAAETPTIDKIKAKGTLVFGVESTYPPFEFIVVKDGQSISSGMDVDLGQKIAEKLGVELVTSEMAFDSLIPSLQTGTIDIAGSMTPSAERMEVIDFSDLYYESTNCFIVLKDNVDQYNTKEDFAGKTIGAQLGTVQNTLLVEEFTDSKNLILPKVSTLVQELKNGNIDAICVEAPVADCYVAALPDELGIAGLEIPDEGGGVAITMAKGTEDLQAVINEVIQEMIANGEMQAIYDANIELAKEQIVND